MSGTETCCTRAEGSAAIRSISTRVLHEQAGCADGRPRRRLRKELRPHLVEAAEVREIRVKHLRLHHVAQRRAPRVECLGEIFQDIARLFLDRGAVVRKRGMDARLGGHAFVEVARELTGREDEIAGAGGRRVVRQRPRDAGDGDVHPGHVGAPLELTRREHSRSTASFLEDDPCRRIAVWHPGPDMHLPSDSTGRRFPTISPRWPSSRGSGASSCSRATVRASRRCWRSRRPRDGSAPTFSSWSITRVDGCIACPLRLPGFRRRQRLDAPATCAWPRLWREPWPASFVPPASTLGWRRYSTAWSIRRAR